jgi:hypothetical protein
MLLFTAGLQLPPRAPLGEVCHGEMTAGPQALRSAAVSEAGSHPKSRTSHGMAAPQRITAQRDQGSWRVFVRVACSANRAAAMLKL